MNTHMKGLDPVDPISVIPSAGCPLPFQFGLRDFYIAQMTASELYHAAPEPKTILQYDTGHDMSLDEARADRIGFVLDALEADG